jgi:hypothetical protein
MEPLPRRSFLKLATVSVVGVSAAFMYIQGTDNTKKNSIHATQYGTLLSLTASQADTFFAFIEVALPKDKSAIPSVPLAVLRRADEELYFVSKQIQADLGLALDALSYMPIAYGKFSRFERMVKEDRLLFIQSLRKTTNETVRAIVNNCRILTLYIYYGQDNSWDSIGYDGSYSRLPKKISQQRIHYSSKVGRKIS